MSITEWLDCGVVYKLYESMLRLVKDAENVDQRQNCFLLQTSNGVSRYFSMETKQGLLDVQCAWHRSICTSMMHIKVSHSNLNTYRYIHSKNSCVYVFYVNEFWRNTSYIVNDTTAIDGNPLHIGN